MQDKEAVQDQDFITSFFDALKSIFTYEYSCNYPSICIYIDTYILYCIYIYCPILSWNYPQDIWKKNIWKSSPKLWISRSYFEFSHEGSFLNVSQKDKFQHEAFTQREVFTWREIFTWRKFSCEGSSHELSKNLQEVSFLHVPFTWYASQAFTAQIISKSWDNFIGHKHN